MGLKRQEAIPIRRDKRLPGKRDFVKRQMAEDGRKEIDNIFATEDDKRMAIFLRIKAADVIDAAASEQSSETREGSETRVPDSRDQRDEKVWEELKKLIMTRFNAVKPSARQLILRMIQPESSKKKSLEIYQRNWVILAEETEGKISDKERVELYLHRRTETEGRIMIPIKATTSGRMQRTARMAIE
jgi:hypothetical protein